MEGKLDSVLKSRDITLLTEVCIVKAMVFLVVLDRCENRTINKAEHRRTDSFELWRRLLRVPWTARRSNQSILKEIHPGYSLEGLMLKLKLQSFGHLMGRGDSREKVTDAGKDGRQQAKGTTEDEMVGWHHWLHGREFEQALGDNKDREAWRAAVHGVAKSWTRLINWIILCFLSFPRETRPEILSAFLLLSACIPSGPLGGHARWASQRACKQFTLN